MFKNDHAHVPADFRMSYLASQTLQFVKTSIIHHQSVLPPRVPRYPREDGCGSDVLWAPDGTFLTIRFRLPSSNDLLPVCHANVSSSGGNEGNAPKLHSKRCLSSAFVPKKSRFCISPVLESQIKMKWGNKIWSRKEFVCLIPKFGFKLSTVVIYSRGKFYFVVNRIRREENASRWIPIYFFDNCFGFLTLSAAQARIRSIRTSFGFFVLCISNLIRLDRMTVKLNDKSKATVWSCDTNAHRTILKCKI